MKTLILSIYLLTTPFFAIAEGTSFDIYKLDLANGDNITLGYDVEGQNSYCRDKALWISYLINETTIAETNNLYYMGKNEDQDCTNHNPNIVATNRQITQLKIAKNKAITEDKILVINHYPGGKEGKNLQFFEFSLEEREENQLEEKLEEALKEIESLTIQKEILGETIKLVAEINSSEKSTKIDQMVDRILEKVSNTKAVAH